MYHPVTVQSNHRDWHVGAVHLPDGRWRARIWVGRCRGHYDENERQAYIINVSDHLWGTRDQAIAHAERTVESLIVDDNERTACDT